MTEKKASLYIHIPYCISKCRYCDFFSRPCNKTVPDDYIKALANELQYRFAHYDCDAIDTVYVGGGTPSLLSSAQIKSLFDSIRAIKPFTENAEINFEVNPDDINVELLQALEAAGVNRLSCGIQSMNQKVLEYAGRRASQSVNRTALKLLQQSWHKKLSLDLISALPYETKETFMQALQEVIAAGPDHISMYSLTIEEKTPFGKALESGVLEYDFEQADALWLFARDYLESHGYPQYEVSNFAAPENRCRHNLVYWNHGDYIGAGSGATGTIYNKDGTGLRWTNTLDVEKYIQFWKNWNDSAGADLKETSQPQSQTPFHPQLQTTEHLSLETSEFEFFMMSLRKTDGFFESDFTRCFNKPLPQKFLEVFIRWQEKGLAEKNVNDASHNTTYHLNKQGLLFLNTFLEELI